MGGVEVRVRGGAGVGPHLLRRGAHGLSAVWQHQQELILLLLNSACDMGKKALYQSWIL